MTIGPKYGGRIDDTPVNAAATNTMKTHIYIHPGTYRAFLCSTANICVSCHPTQIQIYEEPVPETGSKGYFGGNQKINHEDCVVDRRDMWGGKKNMLTGGGVEEDSISPHWSRSSLELEARI